MRVKSGLAGVVRSVRGDGVMRPRMGILALVMALMLMSMAGISAIAQDATPEASPEGSKVNGIDCGSDIPILDLLALPDPEGVDVVFACGYFEGNNTEGGLAVLGTLRTVEAGVTIENPDEGINIRQTGTANVTVIQG